MVDARPIECERTRHAVSVALDGELSPFEETRVAAHLRSCASCRVFREEIAGVATRMRQTPLARMRYSVSLPAARRAQFASARRVASAGAVAAAVVLALVGVTQAPTSASRNDGALIASALARPSTVNDLLIDVIRPTLASRQHAAIAYGAGGIGAYKPPLPPGA